MWKKNIILLNVQKKEQKKRGITETRDITKADGPKAHKHL